MEITIVTPPAMEPVDLAEAKLFAGVDIDDDDSFISSLITTARVWCETYCNSTFVTTQYQLSLSHFPWNTPYGLYYTMLSHTPYGMIRLPLPPLQSVDSITYEDPSTGSVETLSPTLYRVQRGTRGRICPAYGSTYPTTRHELDSVILTFTCGYGDNTAVPQGIKTAICYMVKQAYYGIRSMEADSNAIPIDLQNLLAPYVLGWSA